VFSGFVFGVAEPQINNPDFAAFNVRRRREKVSFERIECAHAKGLLLAGQSYKQKIEFCYETMKLFGE